MLEHNNIRVLSIEGKDSQRKRVATLEAFKNSGRDGPRVLLISSVGSLGLNIAFANILIIVVRPIRLTYVNSCRLTGTRHGRTCSGR